MRALVTGAGGFLGSHLVRALLADEWDVIAVVRSGSRRLATSARLKIVSADLQESLNGPGVDVVFSLAATADPNEALANPREAYINGVLVMLTTLNYDRTARVIHVSSNEAYGEYTPTPWNFDPKGPYAIGKACQDAICAAEEEVDVRVVVTQSLFGERQQRDKLVPTALRHLRAGTSVPIQHHEGRPATRPFLYAGGLAKVLVETSYRDWSFCRAGGVPIPLTTVVECLASGLGEPLHWHPVECGDRPGHEVSTPSVGWYAPGKQPTQEEALERFVQVGRWYRNHPEWLDG